MNGRPITCWDDAHDTKDRPAYIKVSFDPPQTMRRNAQYRVEVQLGG